jgi:hypothetical protein
MTYGVISTFLAAFSAWASILVVFSRSISPNRRGEFPTDTPVTPQDLVATNYRHLCIDPGQTFTDSLGKPVPILTHGEPIRQLI